MEDAPPVYMPRILLPMPHQEENKAAPSGLRPALRTGITCLLGKFAISHSASGGQRIMLSRRLATDSLVVLKHGLAFERKDPSPFLKDIARSPWPGAALAGILHKDMCVSSGAWRQAGRLPDLAAHLPHAGHGPSSCQARAAGTLHRGKDGHCSCPSSGRPAEE